MIPNKPQAIQLFWEQFGVAAYDENTVPENATFPRITYTYAEDDFERPVALSASVWDRSYSWKRVQSLTETIRNEIGYGGILIPCEDGQIWLKTGAPFAQRMGDEDDAIRRIYINIEAEFLSA